MNKISLAITTYNRFDMTIESFAQVIDDDRISQIVLQDDDSTDRSAVRLANHFRFVPKVVVYQNEGNLDCYENKFTAISHCVNEFCCLWDSDNIFSKEYIDILYSLEPWQRDVAYMPSFAAPSFSYKEFEGLMVTKENVNEYFDKPFFQTMLNCMNYFVCRDSYIDVWDNSVNPHTADSIYQNYNWLKSGKKILIVPNLTYEHRIHPQGHYVNNVHLTGNFLEETEQKIRNLK